MADNVPLEQLSVKLWDIIEFPKVIFNSFQITVISVAGIVLISSMTAYRFVRRPTLFNKILFTVFVASMIIPFQSIMLQLVRVTSLLELRGNLFGIVICYFGFGLALSVFLFHGFIKTVPLEIEESAVVDGCTPYGVFLKIVFPLLRPIMVTIIILNILWIWNDYLLPVLVIGGNKELLTIPLAIKKIFRPIYEAMGYGFGLDLRSGLLRSSCFSLLCKNTL